MKESLDDILMELIHSGGSQGQVLWLVDENLLPLYSKATLGSGVTVLTNRFTERAPNATPSELIINDFDFTSLGLFDRIIYRISKEKPLVHHCINQSLAHLKVDGELVLIGEKQDGIKSIAKNAIKTFDLDGEVKKNGGLYLAYLPAPKDTTQQLPTQDYTALREITVADASFYTKPGIFGWEKVDKGSYLLLQELPTLEKHMKNITSILDLGCGWGYLMSGTCHIDADRRVATDNNAAAVDATKKNAEKLGMNVDVILDDCGSHIREKFDLILCNPPFHQGFSVDNSLLEKFVKNAARMSRRSTRCVFVVNQFIPLDTVAEHYFSEVKLLNHQEGFKVWQMRH